MKTAKTLTLILSLATLAACNPNEPATPAATTPAAAPAAAMPPAEVLSAPTPAGLNGETVDTCAMLDAAAAAQSLGSLLKDPEAQAPQGSLLGGCNYLGDKGMVMLTARPAAEFQATVDYAARRGGAKAVTVAGGDARQTPVGLMFQPAGKAYFLVVYPLVSGKFDEAVALQLATQLKF